jgi:hypothetical protein
MGVCAPNQPTCVGDVLTVCDADGAGYLPGGTDCTVNPGTFCCEGACRSPNTYTISDNATTIRSTVVNDDGGRLNIFKPSGAAYLMGIQQSLKTTTVMNLAWHVFESLRPGTGFIDVFQKRTSSIVGTDQNSGPMCVKLLDGRYYAIGIAWQSRPVTVYSWGVSFPHSGALGPVVESYAPDIFPAPTPYWQNSPAGSLYGQKLTFAR